MHPLSERLFETYYRDFASADRSITWTASEREVQMWLEPKTLLLGRVDAEGIDANDEPFFLEIKSMSYNRARYIADEKMKWRTDPQALTYGVLLPNTKKFTVRWVIKPDDKGKYPPRTDFEWYSYTRAEIVHWESQLMSIASEIRTNRIMREVPFRTNFGNCFRYGTRYACPFFERCSKQEWSKSMGSPRTPHLILERELDKRDPDLVVLDASRVAEYLECPEAYRRKYEGEGYSETSEAMEVGTGLHSMVSAHINQIKERHARAH